MNFKKIIESEFNAHLEVVKNILSLRDHIEYASKECIKILRNSGKIVIFGNGGSAADSQHIAAELVGRFKNERTGLPAIAITTDSSALTSIANDFGYEFVFARQLEAILNPNDIVIAISTSGNSTNVINALNYCNSIGVKSIGLSGGCGGTMNDLCDINIVIPSNETPRIQEMHILIGHTICQIIDDEFSINLSKS